jgi:hypothetical protein|tara:strand:- start:31 stop:207 length:177 start_codon:yes stop_codon:yes gene_type:complete
MSCKDCFLPKLNEQEINLLLVALDSCIFPIEQDLPQAITTHSAAKRAERKLRKMLDLK